MSGYKSGMEKWILEPSYQNAPTERFHTQFNNAGKTAPSNFNDKPAGIAGITYQVDPNTNNLRPATYSDAVKERVGNAKAQGQMYDEALTTRDITKNPFAPAVNPRITRLGGALGIANGLQGTVQAFMNPNQEVAPWPFLPYLAQQFAKTDMGTKIRNKIPSF